MPATIAHKNGDSKSAASKSNNKNTGSSPTTLKQQCINRKCRVVLSKIDHNAVKRKQLIWKKKALSVHRKLILHKSSPIFLLDSSKQPNYRYSAIDLHTIKKKIANGQINNPISLELEVCLMCYNMQLSNEEDSYKSQMAIKLMIDCKKIIADTFKNK